MQFTERDSGLVVPVEKISGTTDTGYRAPLEYPTAWQVVHYDDLSASVRYRLVNSHVCECEAFGWLYRNEDGTVTYGQNQDEASDSIDGVDPILSGDVKWDGCANLNFHTGDFLRHFCSFDDVREFAALLETIYCEAAGILDKAGTWDREIPDRSSFQSTSPPPR